MTMNKDIGLTVEAWIYFGWFQVLMFLWMPPAVRITKKITIVESELTNPLPQKGAMVKGFLYGFWMGPASPSFPWKPEAIWLWQLFSL